MFENGIIHGMLRIFGSKITLVSSDKYLYKLKNRIICGLDDAEGRISYHLIKNRERII